MCLFLFYTDITLYYQLVVHMGIISELGVRYLLVAFTWIFKAWCKSNRRNLC